ncbi:MAG TPA: biopolymer transporter ExbD [Fermentimonas caenicola]|jgi:biopolymer transport protein ExbD|uniref:Biopolymer transporter ExbD n=1 Tax=Fermentimonas caenicola TaxID=1562970 RepID=A0A098C3A0_9BACT|nr:MULTISPECIES: biopolymer transporter ExbD [Lascolabacillus]MBP6174748.1 biopolymer transporter ExbD [Fermentimonas sp.]MDI9625497.1 biopolymer transporter ExbD [Bacteroidota bacterium]TAH60350.1 MAG: biopolymer transporter ExbD [Fermentimonas caenicola]MBP6196362.1 biopolymer transporter ExbD [Fermentimonas sp.]MBP7103639.1 biopolymer transporter ExbD [Fermentimonas sp.]
MGKFNKSGKKEVPAMNTSSMPDIVFAVLFFFIITTTLRSETLMVRMKLPTASEVQKLEKKSLVTYINIGPPLDARLGTGTQMQLNDRFAQVADIQNYIAQEKASMNEADQPLMTVSIKADENTRMQYITDVKQALRKAYALKISYSARKGEN